MILEAWRGFSAFAAALPGFSGKAQHTLNITT
jgi:hypothetical protein